MKISPVTDLIVYKPPQGNSGLNNDQSQQKSRQKAEDNTANQTKTVSSDPVELKFLYKINHSKANMTYTPPAKKNASTPAEDLYRKGRFIDILA